MPVSSRLLKHYFGDDYKNLIQETNESLIPLGLQIYKFGEEFLLQFDLEELRYSKKGQLLNLLMNPELDLSKKPEKPWEHSSLTENEKATIVAAFACARKFQSDVFSIDSLKEILMPQGSKSLMTKGQFDATVSGLKRKNYLKRGPARDTLAIDWRLHAEWAILEKENPEDVEDFLNEATEL